MLTTTALQEYAAAGTVKQNYVNILLMLLRLRQACDHPHLVRGYDSSSSWMSSLEMVKKLPMERQHELLNCLQSCSALCALCNVTIPLNFSNFHVIVCDLSIRTSHMYYI
jgi:SNF2 family DNA or RNA helicase